LKIRLAAALTASALSLPLFAADSYTVDPRHTFPSFEVLHLGFSTQRGRFNKTGGKIVLDRAAGTGSVDIVIDAASVSTGEPKLEEHLRSEDFLHVQQHPTITFKSTKLNFDGDKLVSVEGELTIRGVTRPTTLTVTNFRCGPHPMNKQEMCGADATTIIKRSDFGVKYAIPAVADEVKLEINVEAFKS
jgi:polyisoprenoid-binding protein YceI